MADAVPALSPEDDRTLWAVRLNLGYLKLDDDLRLTFRAEPVGSLIRLTAVLTDEDGTTYEGHDDMPFETYRRGVTQYHVFFNAGMASAAAMQARKAAQGSRA